MNKITREIEVESLSMFWGSRIPAEPGGYQLSWNHESSIRDVVATPAEAVQRIAEVLGVNITLGGTENG